LLSIFIAVVALVLVGIDFLRHVRSRSSSVLRPHQHSIGYTGDGFCRSKHPTNSIKVLKENYKRQIKQRKQHKTQMH